MKVADIWVRDEVWMTITGLEPQDSTYLWNKYGIEVEGSWFMPARKLGRWDGKIRFFDKNGRTYLKLLEQIAPMLDSWGYELRLHDERRPVKQVTHSVTENWFDGKSQVHIELRDYQVEVVNACLSAGSGIVVAATGAGKTIMVAALCDALAQDDMRALVIVPSADLVDQTANTFKLACVDCGTYSGGVKDTAHQHVIGTWQAIQNNPFLIQEFDCIIVDEAHGASAKVIGDLITNHGKNIAYRFGFTGTLPKSKSDQMTLFGSLGEKIIEIPASYLIERGFLSSLKIEPIQIQEIAEEDFPDYAAEKAYISRQPDRLDLIADLIIDRAAKYGNTLVLVNSIKQGQQLQKLIKDSIFLYGATENDVRAEWYSTFATRDDLIVLATFGIASTGISIDRVFHLMLLDAGKSFIRCIQSIGRGLRKAGDKSEVHVSDVHSSLKWGKKHFRERKKYYTEAGYPVLKTVKVKA